MFADAGGACALRRGEPDHAEEAPRWSVWVPTDTPGTLFHILFAHTGAQLVSEVVSADINYLSPRRRAARQTHNLVPARPPPTPGDRFRGRVGPCGPSSRDMGRTGTVIHKSVSKRRVKRPSAEGRKLSFLSNPAHPGFNLSRTIKKTLFKKREKKLPRMKVFPKRE